MEILNMFKCKCKHGASLMVKTITITDEAYEALKRMKSRNESFSSLILRLIRSKKGKLSSLAGKWSKISDNELEKVLRELHEAWSKWHA